MTPSPNHPMKKHKKSQVAILKARVIELESDLSYAKDRASAALQRVKELDIDKMQLKEQVYSLTNKHQECCYLFNAWTSIKRGGEKEKGVFEEAVITMPPFTLDDLMAKLPPPDNNRSHYRS